MAIRIARHRARAQPPEDAVRDRTRVLERRQIEVARHRPNVLLAKQRPDVHDK
jgi:hypothetical protein